MSRLCDAELMHEITEIDRLRAVRDAAESALVAMAAICQVIVARGLADEVVTDGLLAEHGGKMATLQRAIEASR